jgi:hypothetical protein
VKPFGYGRDPLCLIAIGLYAVNRWVLLPYVVSGGGFMRYHFNDLLLIPAALPLVLWVQRKLGWRLHDEAPHWSEILLHLGVWGLLCEIIGPQLVAHATADWRDLVAYTVGAAVAGGWWQLMASGRRSAPAPATLKTNR